MDYSAGYLDRKVLHALGGCGQLVFRFQEYMKCKDRFIIYKSYISYM